MHPSSAQATVVVDELLRGGVRDAVLCPGSRNAPLSFALFDADAAGRLRLHVRIDERGAGFLAAGIAARSGRPVPVVCTSGTAAANLHPAALEADHAGIPLLLITADRPPDLVGTGANQTIRQDGLYGPATRWSATLGLAQRTTGQNARWRSAVCRALAAARGRSTNDPGPVHLNVPFAKPLIPDVTGSVSQWPEELAGRPSGGAWTHLPAGPRSQACLALSARTLVVAGHGAPPLPGWLAALPRVAEPASTAWGGSLLAGPWLLGAGTDRADRLCPDQVLVVGRPTLHRQVQRLLADAAVHVTVLANRPGWPDVAGSARSVAFGVPVRVTDVSTDPAWTVALRAADAAVADAVGSALADLPWPTGLSVARDVVAALPAGGLLVLGSSNPVRDVALAAVPREDVVVHANRGVAGIDGTVSTAIGAALAHDGPSYALVGDLTFLHDATALVAGPAEPRPDLTIVVVNDDGGGIFNVLEQGAPAYSTAFERVFGTPHGVDLAALCAATSTPYQLVSTSQQLRSALLPATGIRVVEVRTERAGLRDTHASLHAAVRAALA